MTSRTLWMRELRRAMAVAHYAEHLRISTAEARERIQTELAASRRRVARDPGVSRRSFLKGAGAVGLVGAGLLSGGRAHAKRASSSSARIGIVGAGMGGLAAAYTLHGKGVNATVYDAAHQVGGRVRSIGGMFGGPLNIPGQVAELGGEFIDTLHKTMLGYCQEFGLDVEDQLKEEEGEATFWIGGQAYTADDVVEHYRDFVPAMQDDLRSMSAAGPTAYAFSPEDEILDYTDLEEYLVSRGASPFLADVIRESYRNEYGRDVSEQSCLNFLLLIHADRRSNWRPWGVFSDERYHVIGGNQQIPVEIASRLVNPVQLGHRLVEARKVGQAYRLTFDVDGGPTIEADYDYVVFATPFSTLRNVTLHPSLGLPSWKRDVIDGLQYGTNSKMVLAFDGRPWADYGSSGNLVSFGTPNLNSGWETNPSRASANSAVYVDYSGGARGAGMDEGDPAGEANAWLSAFDQVYPGASAQVRRHGNGDPMAVVKNWSADPNHNGAYTCNAPGYFTTLCDYEGVRVDNLLFAGEHANSFYEWQGWIEGAAVSGNAAGTEIVKELQQP